MALHGDIALLTRSPDTEAAVQQLKRQHPQAAHVTALSVANDADIARTIASASLDPQQTFDAVVCYNDAIEQLSTDLSAVSPLLKADGVLELHVANVSADDADEQKNAILMALMIGGFVDASFGSSAASRAVYPELTTAVCCVATKQSLESAVMPLEKKKETLPTEAAAAAVRAPAIRKWTVLADEFEQDQEDDMVDEDTLLDDTEEVLLAAKAECGDVGGAKKRACKNCTCGLKDGEDKPVMSEKDLNQLVSGCGNCFKGDAFRCGSCPFLGKPAFKPGMEKVLLNLDDADDI